MTEKFEERYSLLNQLKNQLVKLADGRKFKVEHGPKIYYNGFGIRGLGEFTKITAMSVTASEFNTNIVFYVGEGGDNKSEVISFGKTKDGVPSYRDGLNDDLFERILDTIRDVISNPIVFK